MIFLSEFVDEVQQVKKSECKDRWYKRERAGAGVHEREEERKERPSIRKRDERRERERYFEEIERE